MTLSPFTLKPLGLSEQATQMRKQAAEYARQIYLLHQLMNQTGSMPKWRRLQRQVDLTWACQRDILYCVRHLEALMKNPIPDPLILREKLDL